MWAHVVLLSRMMTGRVTFEKGKGRFEFNSPIFQMQGAFLLFLSINEVIRGHWVFFCYIGEAKLFALHIAQHLRINAT